MNRVLLNPSLNWFITFIASFLIWVMVAALIFVGYKAKGKKKREVVIKALISFLFSWVVCVIIKKYLPIARPFRINGYSPLTLTIPQSYSFPSWHSCAAFAVALSVFFYNVELGFVFMLAAIIVAVGRILANVHFLVDIIGGALIGSLIAYLVNKFIPLKK